MCSLLVLTEEERKEIGRLVSGLAVECSSTEDEGFLDECEYRGERLPSRCKDFLCQVRSGELGPDPALIHGPSRSDDVLPNTPAHWQEERQMRSGLWEEILTLLYSSRVGKVFGWDTQQGGRIVHDVLPIRGDEDRQIGTGSKQEIEWHIEDAFSDFRASHLALLCLRNPEATPTTFAVPDLTRLARRHLQVLFEPRFPILPDLSHQGGGDGIGRGHIAHLLEEPPRIAVLEGNADAPTLRLDPFFMPFDCMDTDAREALSALIAEVNRCLKEVTLTPGACVFINNSRSVHGRRPFSARYNGRDRWLKRVNIAAHADLGRVPARPGSARVILAK